MALPSTSLFVSLPDEVLLYQLAFFQDLKSHLGFSITCRRIYAVYDESLWRRIALFCGLGRPLDLGLRRVAWRDVCASAANHSRSCQLSDCSEHQLAKGRSRDLLERPWSLILDSSHVASEHLELCLSSVFEGMSGDLEDLHAVSIPCNARRLSWFSRLFRKPDLLRSISRPSSTNDWMVTSMAHHLPASCALATAPAVDQLLLDFGQVTVQVRNNDGVCVWDVITALARKMSEVVPSEPGNEDTEKGPVRMCHLIAQEWQQYVLLRFSLHGRGSVNVHLDLGEEIFEDNTASLDTGG